MLIIKLQFDWDTNDEEGTSQIAICPFGIYRVDQAWNEDSGYHVYFEGYRDPDNIDDIYQQNPETREIAMQLAQQDFERRVQLCIQES